MVPISLALSSDPFIVLNNPKFFLILLKIIIKFIMNSDMRSQKSVYDNNKENPDE